MDLSNNDLEEYVEKLENLFLNQKSNKKHRNELTLLIENISCELNASRKSENSIRDDLKKLIECGDFDINQKYIQAEEKCSKQEIEIVLLTTKLEELRNQSKLDLEIQKNAFLNKIKNIEETLGSQIVNLNSQLESQRICHETKEQELYNDMQMMQAASALEWDEKESNYKKQLADAATNLRFFQSRIRSMQCEINQLQTQLSMMKCPPIENTVYPQDTPIQQVKNQLTQKKLYDTGCTDYMNQNQLGTKTTTESTENASFYSKSNENKAQCHSENSSEHSRPASSVSTVEVIRSYQKTSTSNVTGVDRNPWQEETPNRKSPEQFSEPINCPINTRSTSGIQVEKLYAPVVFKGKNRPRAKHILPPLKQVSNNAKSGTNNATNKEKQQRKRKLYDPNCYDYLSTE